MKPSFDLHWLESRPIAHRGLHGPATGPENSLSAFEAAAVAGMPIELDVRCTGDGKVVVFHDSDLARSSGNPAKIRDLTWEELRKFRLFGSSESIPSLDELLAKVAGRVPLLIEIKRERSVPPFERQVLDCLKNYRGPFAIQSFNPWTVSWFRKHAPGVPRGILSCSFSEESDLSLLQKGVLRYLVFWPLMRPHFIAYDIESVPAWWIRVLRSITGASLVFWTVRTPAQAQKARALGGNIIFEGPEVAAEVRRTSGYAVP